MLPEAHTGFKDRETDTEKIFWFDHEQQDKRYFHHEIKGCQLRQTISQQP